MQKQPQETSAQSSRNHITIIVSSSNIPQQIKFQYNCLTDTGIPNEISKTKKMNERGNLRSDFLLKLKL